MRGVAITAYRYLRCLALILPLCSVAMGSNLQWSELPSIPDQLGLGGPIVGVHNGALIVAGGANFPDGPPWPENGRPAGSKAWHDRIYVLESGAAGWIDAGKLPMPLAYAATASTPEGIYVLGGETYGVPATGAAVANYPVADVLRLKWDSGESKIVIEERALPHLPKASHYHAAAVIDRTLYVVASHANTDKSRELDSKSFWSIDLSMASDTRQWNALAPWPGAPRYQMAVAVQASGADDRYASPTCLYLFGGSTWRKNEAARTGSGSIRVFHGQLSIQSQKKRMDSDCTFSRSG